MCVEVDETRGDDHAGRIEDLRLRRWIEALADTGHDSVLQKEIHPLVESL
jgi:hypothetical protein